jgi:hypothetical protein
MQFQQIKPKTKLLFVFVAVTFLMQIDSLAQVNSVEFGKNRVQYRKFKWEYYQTTNFNTYFYQDGKAIANYVAQIAEEELPAIEQFVEYGLQRRANVVIYNNFNELEQSNIGLNLDWQTSSGGTTKMVNNKMIVYFNANHVDLRRQVRQGIARILVDNILFGDDLGEFAANQALLDLPKWLVDGYVAYVAENWSPQLDNDLKLALLSGEYRNFYNFAFVQPLLAGHAFWNYLAEKYKKENVTYFLYLARVYRNLNAASQRICKKKFKEVLKEFMLENEQRYYADIKGRRDVPRGRVTIVEETSEKKQRDFFAFTPNPAPRSQTHAVVEYIKGQNCVVLYENMVDRKVLLKNGIRVQDNERNPHYPLLAWDGKGTKLACIYWSEGRTKLFVYDMVRRYKTVKQDLNHFEQVQDFEFMLDNNTLLMSAVRHGQPDIFVYKIDQDSYEQVTNDIYADLDASFVAFPSKRGIIFSSNRPNPLKKGGDTAVPVNKFNIFLADNYNRSEFRQITQLTDMKFGDARFPLQYNVSHFTFISDESGIANRWAGFFTTVRAGLDTVFIVGDEVLRNPDPLDLDSTLKAWGKNEPDSFFTFSITNDSVYSFPITNYSSNLLETKLAGESNLLSEVRQQGNLKFLYKLTVDQNTLRRRNINPKPTEYRRKTIAVAQTASGQALQFRPEGDTARNDNIFETGFEKDTSKPATTSQLNIDLEPRQAADEESVLKKAKRFDYKLKFSLDNFSGGFNNDVLITRYQPFTGGLPVVLQNGGAFNGMLKASVFDLFEDIRFTGAMRLPLIGGIGTGAGSTYVPVNQSLFDGGGEWFGRIDYLKKRIDYSLIYYRRTELGNYTGVDNSDRFFEGKMFTNLYQGVMKYPLDRIRSIRLAVGYREDKIVIRGDQFDTVTLKFEDAKQTYGLSHLEYVHDNAIQKAQNIWNGLRYKIYVDLNSQINDPPTFGNETIGRTMFNVGFDARHYLPIYRNFIWALRAAGDFSWGEQKILYYLGGVDSWMFPKYSQEPRPEPGFYAFQSLAVNMRGFPQNVANGNNAFVINSELRFPVFSTLINRPINNAFLRNFQIIQFVDLGTAWSGPIDKIARPEIVYTNPDNSVVARFKAGGIGPFVGGYGFGVRSTLLGYFLRLDAGWEMNGIFKGEPFLHFAMGLDF